MREDDRPFWFSRGAWALRAIVDAQLAITGKPPCLWLPDYFCNQAIWPLRQTDVRLVFYPVDENLRPEWSKCAALANHASPDLFVLVHYFGFTTDSSEARAFCDTHGASLIEDAAHMLAPTVSVGQTADFVVYSQYKHLPLPDGGLLIVRPAAAALVDAVETSWRTLAHTAPPSGVWVAKRFLQWAVPSLADRIAGRRNQAFDDDPPVERMPETAAISIQARRLIVASTDSLTAIAASRKSNERVLRDLFSTKTGIRPLFPPPGDNDVPYRAVFRAKDGETALHWYNRIRSTGNVIETWPDLPPEVRSEPEKHLAAIALRKTLLTLPINADRTAEALSAAYETAL